MRGGSLFIFYDCLRLDFDDYNKFKTTKDKRVCVLNL